MDAKCLYSLYVVCFTALSVSCGGDGGGGGGGDGGDSSSSVEREAAASYEDGDNVNYGNKRTLLYDEDIDEKIASLDTSRIGLPGRGGVGGSMGGGVGGKSGGGGMMTVGGRGDGPLQPAKRFIVPISPADLGIDVPISRPYFVHSKPPRNHHRQQLQQQQPQQQHHHHNNHQPQNQLQQQYSPGPYYHQGRGPPGGDNYGFAPSSPGGHSGYNEQSENSFYQPSGGGGGGGGGGGENGGNFDTAGFTDFAGPSSPPSPSGFRGGPSSESPPSPFTASPQLHGPFDGGSSGQQQFDPTGFGGGGGGHDPSAGYGAAVFGDGFDFPSPHQQPAPVVHKSIYVHVAPPDDEPPRKQRVIMPNVPPKKNYQIVFIKAPTAPTPIAPIIPPPPQHTDKTLIYVLHPKPEEAPPIRIPAPPVTQPLKPEVYFIKYKHRGGGGGGGGGGDSHHHGSGGDYGGGSGVLPHPGDEFGGGGGRGGGKGRGDESSGYSHRRYGRGDKTSPPPPAQLTLPPLREDSSAESRPSAAAAEASAAPPQSSAESPPPSSVETARPSFADDVESPGPSFAEAVRPFAEESSHRSYDDRTSRSYGPPPPPTAAAAAAEPPSSVERLSVLPASSPSPAAESQLATATGGLDDVDMSLERQRELTAAEELTTVPPGPGTAAGYDDGDASRESAARDAFLHGGGYSLEYSDASVDSSNLSESHAALSAPKGKNGH